jgi:hypothetical protein
MTQHIENAVTYVPIIGKARLWPMTGRGSAGQSIGRRVTIPGNLASGGPGGKIEVGRARWCSPLSIFSHSFACLIFLFSETSLGNST